jgi:hypothetical protein
MLVPADVEGASIAYLKPLLGCWVAGKVPNPRPSDERYVRITRAGGQPRNLVLSDPRLLVECWGPDSVQALELAQLAYGYLRLIAPDGAHGGFLGEIWVSQMQLTEPANVPDPDTASPRYQFLAQPTTSLQEFSP